VPPSRGTALGLVVGAALALSPVASAEGLGVELGALARSGARPAECGGGVREPAARWARARTPGLGAYCDALARGYAALVALPAAAREGARAAERALPGRAGPLVLEARVDVVEGEWERAFTRFRDARARAASSVDDPAALHDLAVAALRSGHPAEALDAYRALVPRVDLLGDRAQAIAVLVEGAAVAMSFGPEHLSEAVGYGLEARRRGALPGVGSYALAVLALAYERQGHATEATAVADEAPGAELLEADRARGGRGRLGAPVLPGAELDALIATLAERSDRALAIERWQSYLASDAGRASPFAAQARARLEALRSGTRRR
jgi:hypothetical protein